MRKISVLALLCLCATHAFPQGHPAVAREYVESITTYPFSDPSPIPLLSPVYPYFRFDGFTDKPVQKQWKVVALENDYIKVLILPQVGGKVWTAIEKSTGKPFLYFNHVLKFRDVAMRGPWTSGGLESNFGIIGHTPNCSTPVDYLVRSNPDGSVSCFIGTLDLLTRSYWRVEINLPADKAYFTTRAFWYNSTPQAQPYYHWMNAALPSKGGLEFIYPGNRYLGHEGEYGSWPVNPANGKKINFYDENDFGGPKSYHVFGKYTDFFGAYWHKDEFGMARYSGRDDKIGKKIWIWGLSRAGMIWENLLTDSDGQYVETQSGRLFNQAAPPSTFTPFKHKDFTPYQSDTWKEYWYPVLGTKGFVEANEFGALNVQWEDGWLKLHFCPVQPVNDTLRVRDGDREVYVRGLHLATLQTFADSVRIGVNPDSLVARLGTEKLIYRSSGAALGRPVDIAPGVDWNSPYALYKLGKEASDEKDYALAETKWKASLEKDANFLPSLVEMAALYYRNMRYEEGLSFAKRALSLDTYDGGANYYYGLINEALGNITDARDGFEVAALSVQYRSAAYTCLAALYLKQNEYAHAMTFAAKAQDANRYNIDALQMQAVTCRKLGNQVGAAEIIDTLLSYDPLNHFARFEQYILHDDPAHKTAFLGGIQNEMPSETLLELAIWYYDRGCFAEAHKILLVCPPMAVRDEWLAFLDGKEAGNLDPSFSFPFRSETASVLESLRTRKDNWVLRYQLALIYRDRNRIAESKALLKACGDEPKFAPFYAVRAAICNDDTAAMVHDLRQAVEIDNQSRYRNLLATLYMNKRAYDSAISLVGPGYKAHPDQYITGMLYARILLLKGDYAQADAILDHLNVIPFEGAKDGHELYRESKLMQAAADIKSKRYKQALVFINQSREWPEHLGVGKPYEADIDTRLEDWMTYLCNGRQDLLDNIIRFDTKVENTQRNYYGANALVTAWAMAQMGKKEDATRYLDQQCKKFPDDPGVIWSRNTYTGITSPVGPDLTERILLQVKEAAPR